MRLCRNRISLRRTAWIAIFALLLQALLPAFHHPAGMALAGALGGASDRTVAALESGNLCLAPGSTAPDDPGKAPAHHMPACALCAAMHVIGGFAPPATPVLALSPRSGTIVPPYSAIVLARRLQHARQQPRAPPFLV